MNHLIDSIGNSPLQRIELVMSHPFTVIYEKPSFSVTPSSSLAPILFFLKKANTEFTIVVLKERSLKFRLNATEQHHQKQLEALSAIIVDLEQELQEVRAGVRTQIQKHQLLLNTNMKLEKEISAYRSLLEGEEIR